MMAISIPTRKELQEQMQSTAAALDDNLVVSEASDFGVRNKTISEALYGIFTAAKSAETDMFVTGDTSEEATLLHAEARGLTRKGATIASGTDCLDVTGTAGATVAIGEELVSPGGQTYQTTSGGSLDVNGEITVSVESITTGEEANRAIGEVLTFSGAPAGLDAEATVSAAIDGGENQETIGELKARIRDAYANPPSAGRFSDWRQWAQAVEGVQSAYCYGPSSADVDGRRGLGIVDVAILKRGTAASRVPSTAVRDNVEDYIEDRRPCTTREYSVMLPTTTAVDVDVELTPKTGYDWDFSDGDAGATVHATGWNSSTLELRLTANVSTWSTEIAVGHRVIAAGQLASVLALPPSTTGADYIKLQPLDDDETELAGFATAPVATDKVYPAGPLTGPALIAIKAYFDSLGPARGTAADPEQDWEDTVRLNKIDAILIDREVDGVQVGVAGIKDTAINAPGANQVPTDAAHPGVPELLIYGVIEPRPVD